MFKLSAEHKKHILSGLVAPISILPAVMAPILVLHLITLLTKEYANPDVIGFGVMVSGFGLVIGEIITLLFGVPVSIYLCHLNKFNLCFLVPISALPSLVIFTIMSPSLFNALIFSYISICVALTYWYLFKKWNNGL